MARLRIRIELNRGGVGVPLHKLASVVDQAQKFFHMLAEDVHVDQSKGEWLGFDFDHESLNFTAEFVGPVTSEQVTAFHAAFDGTTSLRRTTIAQFAGITNAIGEDELLGFGLFLKDQASEPAEWRCLSRRDALRISEEMQLLAGAGEMDQDTRLPAIANSSAGARIFSERQERVEPAKWASHVRDVEANLDRRISRVEKAIEDQSGLIEDLHVKSSSTEDSVRKLLGAVEGFCAQTTRQLEAMAAPAPAAQAALPVPDPVVVLPLEEAILPEAEMPMATAAATSAAEPVGRPAPAPVAEAPAGPPAKVPVAALPVIQLEPVEPDVPMDTPVATPPAAVTPPPSFEWGASALRQPQRSWHIGVAAAFLVMGVIFLGTWVWQNFSDGNPSLGTAPPVVAANDVTPAAPAPVAAPVPVAAIARPTAPAAAPALAPASTIAPAPKLQTGGASLRLEASEPTWVAIRDEGGHTILAKLFSPGEQQSLDLPSSATLRVGNAGGLQVQWNGQSIGPIGSRGQVKEVIFRDGGFRIASTDQP